MQTEGINTNQDLWRGTARFEIVTSHNAYYTNPYIADKYLYRDGLTYMTGPRFYIPMRICNGLLIFQLPYGGPFADNTVIFSRTLN